MLILTRQCIACRKLIPEDGEVPMALVSLEVKWNAKKRKHTAKVPHGEYPCFCRECADEFAKLINQQNQKGLKVI